MPCHAPPPKPARRRSARARPPAPRSFVFCRQRQDESLRRGGDQASIIVLSEHPFSVLKPLSQAAGSLFFSIGGAALQQVGTGVAREFIRMRATGL